MHKQLAITMAAAVAAIAFSGCGSPPPDPAQEAARIYQLGTAEKWPETMAPAKAYALAYPEHTGAHYLLGKAYLHRAEPHLVQAEGELKTAQALLARTERLDGVPWTESKEQYALQIHRDLALVDFRWIREAMRFRLPVNQIRDKLLEAKAEVEAGLKLDPKDSFLGEMKTTVDEYLSGPFKAQEAPPAPPASPQSPPATPVAAVQS